MATYIIQAGPTGPVKIGRADDPQYRLATLQTGHPEQLRIIRLVDTAYDCEGAFHDRYAHLRIRGEWFRFNAEMMTFVPPEPIAEPAIQDIVQRARREAISDVASLIEQIWVAFRGWNTKQEFAKRLANLLQCKRSRAHNLIYGRSRVIEYHEMIGLRAIARKLTTEQAKRDLGASAVPDDDLFTHRNDWGGR